MLLRDKYLNLNIPGYKVDQEQLKLLDSLEGIRSFLNLKFTPIKKIFHRSRTKCGLYIWGRVGRGKSVIADLFYDSIEIKYKTKLHFHEFMMQVHRAMKLVMEKHQDYDNKQIIYKVISLVLGKCNLLYLDEVQVNNIADAAILERLFDVIKKQGIFFILTSNFKPSDLFGDDVNRDRILGFIEIINECSEVLNLKGKFDYRNFLPKGYERYYFYPLGMKTENILTSTLKKLINFDEIKEVKLITSTARTVHIKRAYKDIAIFDFKDICEDSLGVPDYLAIAKYFKIIVILNIPVLKDDEQNSVIRFVTLMDCLYEDMDRIICSADADIDDIYQGHKNIIEFKRAISRLRYMTKWKY